MGAIKLSTTGEICVDKFSLVPIGAYGKVILEETFLALELEVALEVLEEALEELKGAEVEALG